MKKFLLGVFFSLWSTLACAGVTCSLPFNLQNNTTADATQVMANYNALVTCLTNAAAAGNNSDITALLGLLTPITPTFGGSSAFIGSTSSGSANAQVVAVTPSGFSLTTGYRVNFTVGFTNTAATSLNINGTGVVPVFRQTPLGPVAMTGGELQAGQRVTVVYDGTQYQLQTTSSQPGGFGPLVTLASAATTDIGAAPGHFLAITGNAAITSLGASAITALPDYLLVFTGNATLTNSGALVLPSSANIVTAPNDTAVAVYLGAGNWQILTYQRATGVALIQAGPAPTVQRCGSGLTCDGAGHTYTPTAGMVRIKARMCGGGGGGGAAATNNGTNGGATSLSTWTAAGGAAGLTAGTAGGNGGTGGVNGTGLLVVRVDGGSGTGGSNNAVSGTYAAGSGGSNPFGGAGGGGSSGGGAAHAAAAFSCGGGGGGGGGPTSGGGGGAGEYAEFWMTAAQVGASLSYTAGLKGNGGAAGTVAGGNGGDGNIVIEEFYQ